MQSIMLKTSKKAEGDLFWIVFSCFVFVFFEILVTIFIWKDKRVHYPEKV